MSSPTTDTRPYAADSKYQGNDNYGKPRSEYLSRIAAMDDAALLEETEQKIWLSAYASNNRRSDYHWHVDVCYSEWSFRGKEDQYTVAFEAAKRSAEC